MREQWTETLAGLAVIVIAAAFLVYSLSVDRAGRQAGRYEVTARFGEVGSLAPGAAVRVAGVKVGAVDQIALDPKTFLAVAKLSLDKDVKLPADSTAKITSDGLLGGAHVAIAPGGSTVDLKAGSEIENTQGAVDLFSLVGQVIRPQGGGQPAAPAAPAATASKPAPSSASGDGLPDF